MLQDRDVKIDQLERTLENSRRSLNSQAKDMGIKFEAEKKSLKEAFTEEQKEWDMELTAKRNEINSITEELKTSRRLLKDVSREFIRFVLL